MREILCDRGSVRFGRISELVSDMNKLYAIPSHAFRNEMLLNRGFKL